MSFAVSTVAARAATSISFMSLMILFGCTGDRSPSPPTAPSPVAALTLRVEVYERTSETPIQGALVRHHARGEYTDASGQLLISVEAGRETTVEASAMGFKPMTATAILNSDERWAFYLERSSN